MAKTPTSRYPKYYKGDRITHHKELDMGSITIKTRSDEEDDPRVMQINAIDWQRLGQYDTNTLIAIRSMLDSRTAEAQAKAESLRVQQLRQREIGLALGRLMERVETALGRGFLVPK